MSHLFSPFNLRDLAVSNRIAVSPMCQYFAVNGKATAWHQAHLGGLANSGAGMLFIEATAVEPAGRITPGDLGLWDDETEQSLTSIVAGIRSFSSTKLILQLGHAGRKASSHTPWEGGQLITPEDGGWITYAPSAIAHKPGESFPVALDEKGLERIRVAFVESALRAVRMGVDGLELHAAHGYLLHEFLSPISNLRDDAYGGTDANRMRFPLEVFDAVRAAIPSGMPLGVKITGSDWVEGGIDIEQTIRFAAELKRRGVDWVSVSSGGISPLQKITVGPGYQVPFAQQVKNATGLTTIAVGLITEPEQAEDVIASGQADFVALARAMLYNPRWGWHAAQKLNASVDAAPPYWRAPPAGHESIFNHTKFGAR